MKYIDDMHWPGRKNDACWQIIYVGFVESNMLMRKYRELS